MKARLSSISVAGAAALVMAITPIGGGVSPACGQRPDCTGQCYGGWEHCSACQAGCDPSPYDVCTFPEAIIPEEDWTCALPQFGCDE